MVTASRCIRWTKYALKQLAHGQKQWLEIGMVVASKADLLLRDEPAAGMSRGEAEQTAGNLPGNQISFIRQDVRRGFRLDQVRVSRAHPRRPAKKKLIRKL